MAKSKGKNPNKNPSSGKKISRLVLGFYGAVIFIALVICTGLYVKSQDLFAISEECPYSEEVQKAFFDRYIDSTINALQKGEAPFSELGVRYRFLLGEIGKKYGKGLGITISPRYESHSHMILAGSHATAGDPVMAIYVPAQIDMSKAVRLEFQGDAELAIRGSVVVSMLHECEHLALGRTGRVGATPAEMDEDEICVWAETCEHSLSLLEKSGIRMHSSHRFFYEAWKECGRDIKSKQWRDSIKETYQHTRHD